MTERRCRPVYEVVAGEPSWGRLYRLAMENMSRLATKAIVHAIKTEGRVNCEDSLMSLRHYLINELPASIIREVLEVCLARDRFQCHHNPTDCLALELWRVFYSEKYTEVHISHHEFAFPKTTNYPDIVQNLDRLISQMSNRSPPHTATTTSFKLELKQCEIGFLLQDRILSALIGLKSLRVLEVPSLGSDELLNVIATNCTNLEVLNLKGSAKRVSDAGFMSFANRALCRDILKKLDVSRCSLTPQVLFALKKLQNLQELRVSTTVLDEIHFSCEGQAVLQTEAGETIGLDKVALTSVDSITVENDNYVQVSINKVMIYLRNVFPRARDIQLVNCIACELHVTLTQHPTNITYMREHIHTLDLINANYFHFPRLVYPCPNLESLCIEKPTNDIFNIDQQNVPLLYGNTIPFSNLKRLRLSPISLTNLTHFLSKSSNLRKFKVTNIGRRDRPRWTDQRIKQILSPESVPMLTEFHVSCLPNEGFSTMESLRYLHLTKETVRYLTENFRCLKRIGGIESWDPRDCNRESLNALLNVEHCSGRFSVTSI